MTEKWRLAAARENVCGWKKKTAIGEVPLIVTSWGMWNVSSAFERWGSSEQQQQCCASESLGDLTHPITILNTPKQGGCHFYSLWTSLRVDTLPLGHWAGKVDGEFTGRADKKCHSYGSSMQNMIYVCASKLKLVEKICLPKYFPLKPVCQFLLLSGCISKRCPVCQIFLQGKHQHERQLPTKSLLLS